jgi:hypothetical protein
MTGYWKCKNCGEDCCVREELDALRARVVELEGALEWYADEANWVGVWTKPGGK